MYVYEKVRKIGDFGKWEYSGKEIEYAKNVINTAFSRTDSRTKIIYYS